MAGKTTALITGSNAKIKVDGVTMAYATDITYDVTVQTIPVERMGQYEVLANEPIAMTVAGSFSVIRYTKAAKGIINGANDTGNGVGNWKGTTEKNGMKTHLNPGDILTAKTVDIEIYQKFINDPEEGADATIVKKIINARLTRMSGSVNKRGVLTEGFAFVAELIEDDSYTASPSGEKDLSA